MNKTNFTPGPWRVTEEIDGIYAGKSTVVFAGDRRVVSVGQTRIHHRECAEANAHLIAAAPEMYEALEQLLPHAERMSSSDFIEYGKTDWMSVAIKEARAALAKARGEN